MLKKLGKLRNNIQKLILKKKLSVKRSYVEIVLQKASISFAEINSLIKELQENVELTTQLMDTYSSPDLAEAAAQSAMEKNFDVIERDPLLQEVSRESRIYLLENAKKETETANCLLQNLLQIQRVIADQEKIIYKEKEFVFTIHEHALDIEDAMTKANQSCETIDLSNKRIQSVFPAAKHHQHQIKNALLQAKKCLEQMINIQPEIRITESEQAKNVSQTIENTIFEINTTVEDANKIIKETEKAIAAIRHEISITEATQKLADAEISLESANTSLKDLIETQKTIINVGIKIKSEIFQQYPEGYSLVKDLNAYKNIRLTVESIQTILPTAQQHWQQIKIVIEQVKLYIKEAAELQQKHAQEAARIKENQRNSERITITKSSKIAEKSAKEINNAIEEIRKSFDEIVLTCHKNTSAAAAQKLTIAEEEMACANALLQNLLQTQNNIIAETEKIKSEKELYEFALMSNSDTDLSAHSVNVKLAMSNIQDIISRAKQQLQSVKITIAEVKLNIQEAADLQQTYDKQQLLKEEELRKNERITAEKSPENLEGIFTEISEIIKEVNIFITETKEKITIATVKNLNSEELTQKLINVEDEVAVINTLLKDILHTQETIMQKKDEIKREILLLNPSSANLSIKEELEVCKKINYTTQTLQSLLPPAREQWKKIKLIMTQCEKYLEAADRSQIIPDEKDTKQTQERPVNNGKPSFEILIQPNLEEEIQEIKLRIQPDFSKIILL